MLINVTEEDITLGKKGCGDKCPIALAMIKQGCSYPFVEKWRYATYYAGNKKLTGRLSDSAIQFIRDFDAGRLVLPFSFELQKC